VPNQRRELARDAQRHAVDDEDVGAVLLGLQPQHVGHDHADQEGDQRHHGDRVHAHLAELREQLVHAQCARVQQCA